MMVASPSKAQPPSAQHQVPTRARTKGLPLPRPGTWFGTPAAKKAKADEDFVMVSPHAQSSAMAMAMASSSPAEESPTPAARVSQEEEESPLRRVPGQSRSLSLGRPSLGKCSVDQGAQIFMAPPLKQKQRDENDWMRRPRNEPTIDSSPPPPPTPIHAHYSHQPPLPPPPQPRFPSIRNSHSHELSTASSSKSVRFDQSRQRATTDAERVRVLGQKKAVSLDNINIDAGAELFGDGFGVPIGSRTRKATSAHSLSSHSTLSGLPRHRRVVSGDAEPPTMISRSFGHKSGLALSLSPGLPAFSNSDSSLSSFSTANLTPPASTFSPAEPPIFEDVKPLASAFEPQSATVSRKFKPRDSGVGLEDECTKVESAVPPPSVSRPKHLKRPSDQAQLDIETPGFGPGMASGWPSAGGLGFDFLGQATSQLVSQAAAEASMDDKPHMPDTPVKKQAFVHAGSAARALPPSTSAKTALLGSARTSKQVLHLTLTTSSSPTAMEMDEQSPTVRAMIGKGRPSNGVASGSRVGMLRRQSSGAASSSESEEGTPTKSGTSTDRNLLGGAQPSLTTPSPSPKLAAQTSLPRTSTLQAGSAASLMPRLSLPAIQAPKLGRKLNHRQSHPLPRPTQTEDDIFEQRFITLEPLGKGAFSSVVKVQERHGDGVYAVKKAIGVFEGVKDRLRHLEEVDILRHLSRTPHPHVISFVDAWEQNRQLFIQTELCLGSLAFFLEEYGRVVPRLDEARVWKIIRELSDGLHHIHSNGVIHFDIKPANILISSIGDLKIGDFGLASRWPRVDPAEILRGSGLGGALGMGAGVRVDKLEREGDRVYMPPEMLRGEFTMAADIFSFGLVSLEVATNICMPDGGAPWHALRQNDYSIVDLSPLSPALIDLITKCMHSEPALRPTIDHIVTHPVVQRARNGKPALAPEDDLWLVEVLAGGLAIAPRINDGDVEMRDA